MTAKISEECSDEEYSERRNKEQKFKPKFLQNKKDETNPGKGKIKK